MHGKKLEMMQKRSDKKGRTQVVIVSVLAVT